MDSAFVAGEPLPRKEADDVLRALTQPLPSKLRLALFRAYEAHLNSLEGWLSAEQRSPDRLVKETSTIHKTREQVQELVTIIALATFNRFVVLQMKGFATFGVHLRRKYGIKALSIGRRDFQREDFLKLEDIANAFYAMVHRSNIPSYLIEYGNVQSLVWMYDRTLIEKE